MSSDTAARFLTGYTSAWLEIDGLRLHYIDEGPRDAPALVMLHGNPTWSYYYRHLIKPLAKHWRVIVPDHIGCGLSAKPQDYTYRLCQHIDNLERLVAYLDLRAPKLVVHDWGGAIGMGYAVRHPDNVSGFVIFNTAAFRVPTCPLRIRACRIPVLGALLVRGLNGFSRAALRFATSQPGRFTPAVRAAYLAPYDTWWNRVAIHAFVRDIPLEADHPSRPTLDDIEAGLAGLAQHPTMFIWGADDFCFTPASFLPVWRRFFPDAELHVLEDAGHYVVEDAHERILPLMRDFLGKPAS